MANDKDERDDETSPFEYRPGVGGFPAWGGMDRSFDPAGIPIYKVHLLENVRREEGGYKDRGGQEKLFPDRLHQENVGETGTLWDESTGIGNITGIDPGFDDTRYGGPVLYALEDGDVLSVWDGVVQKDYDINIQYGAGETAQPIPVFDEANDAVWGYRTVYASDGTTKVYYVVSRMSYVNHVFGVTPIFSTPELGPTGFGGSVPFAGLPRRLTWSPGDSSYYTITRNGLVMSFTEDGQVTEETDHSLDTLTAKTVYGEPAIFEFQDHVVYIVGYGNGIVEPTVMQPPLCYVKDIFTGVWTIDGTMVDNFVPLTKPVLHRDGSYYLGGYIQTTNSNDPKSGVVLIWEGGLGWTTFIGPLPGDSPVRGLTVLGQFMYYIYDDVTHANNSIIGRFISPTVGNDNTYKFFNTDFSDGMAAPAKGLVAYRGDLYTELFRDNGIGGYDGRGLLWKSQGEDILATWQLAAPVVAPGQELAGQPRFAV